jgi:hypothetical protein
MQVDISRLRWYDNKLYNKYPHLTKREASLWNDFIPFFQNKFLRVAYDVPVSSSNNYFANTMKSVESNWDYLTSLKIDCLVEGISEYKIIEIKPVFDIKAIGQVFVYKTLLPVVYALQKEVSVAILTETTSDDIFSACRDLGIALYSRDRSFLFQ